MIKLDKLSAELRRMVFYNPDTRKYYHGLGHEVRLTITSKPTSVECAYKYAYVPVVRRKGLIW